MKFIKINIYEEEKESKDIFINLSEVVYISFKHGENSSYVIISTNIGTYAGNLHSLAYPYPKSCSVELTEFFSNEESSDLFEIFLKCQT